MTSKQDKLKAAIMEEFIPRFATDAKLIYSNDTAQKTYVLDEAAFAKLGIRISEYKKFPSVILYNSKKKWLFLIEAMNNTNNLISPKRHIELEKLFKQCKAGKIYVTAFLSFANYAKHPDNIAWETEVWIAEMPSHMIHFNGDKFLGPR